MSASKTNHLQHAEIFAVFSMFILLPIIVLWSFQKEHNPAHEKPPIINLPEASGFRFKTGSAELSVEFKEKLIHEIIPNLEKIAADFNVNIIEVIGHTDGQIFNVACSQGNMDAELEIVAQSKDSNDISSMHPTSNTELGLMRSLAIVKFLQARQGNGVPENIQFRPYSAGQLLLSNGDLAPIDRNPNSERRRIELRFTRS